jgi:hypothetical protein
LYIRGVRWGDFRYLVGYLVTLVPAIGGGLAWWLDPKRRAQSALARAKEKPLGAVVEGDHVRVLGVARRGPKSLTAHFSGRRCIAFRSIVEEYPEDGSTKEILRVEHALPFVLAADGVEAQVEGPFLLGLVVDHRLDGDPPREALETLAKYGVSFTDHARRGRRLAFFEATLDDGDTVWVHGRARVVVDPRGRSEALRAQPILRVFEGTKRAPVVVVDEDSPGAPSPAPR